MSSACYWWRLESNLWEPGPALAQPRHRAASLLRDGVLWMLGGRQGSTILRSNEVMMFPGQYAALSIKHWSWIHKEMLRAAVWESNVPPAMKELPLPLMGHCALMVNNDLGWLRNRNKRPLPL